MLQRCLWKMSSSADSRVFHPWLQKAPCHSAAMHWWQSQRYNRHQTRMWRKHPNTLLHLQMLHPWWVGRSLALKALGVYPTWSVPWQLVTAHHPLTSSTSAAGSQRTWGQCWWVATAYSPLEAHEMLEIPMPGLAIQDLACLTASALAFWLWIKQSSIICYEYVVDIVDKNVLPSTRNS